MRVLHVITDLDTGGAESTLVALVTAERPHRPEQHVVSLLPDGVLAHRLRDAGIPVSSLAMRRGRPSIAAVWRLARLLRATKPDAVQSWMYHADLMAAAAWRLSGRSRDTRLYWGVRCSDMDGRRYGGAFRLVRAACARLSHLPMAVVANSDAGRAWHRGLGYRPRRFPVIRNGIDTDRFRPDPDARAALRRELGIDAATPLLVHVARVDPMKHHATLVAALDRLPGVAALAAGAETEALPPHPRLHRLGRRDDAPRLYAAGDAVVSTSAFGEGFSNSVAEGMSAGLPAIATDVGDARILVGDCGTVVPPRQPAAFADAVQAVLAVPAESRAELGRRARDRIVTRFSLQRMVAAFDALHRGELTDPG